MSNNITIHLLHPTDIYNSLQYFISEKESILHLKQI